MGTWMLGPRNTRAWHRFSRGQVGWVLKRYGFVVTQSDPQKVALLKGFITTIHWTLGGTIPKLKTYPACGGSCWASTRLCLQDFPRLCLQHFPRLCILICFLSYLPQGRCIACAPTFGSLVPPLLARFYGFPLSFVRFSWFPWFPLFLCFPCGFRGFYNASPVSIVSMVSLVSMVFYGSHWLCAVSMVSMVSMFSMVSMVSKRRPWFLQCVSGFHGFHGFYGFHWLCAVSMISMVSMRFPWFL